MKRKIMFIILLTQVHTFHSLPDSGQACCISLSCKKGNFLAALFVLLVRANARGEIAQPSAELENFGGPAAIDGFGSLYKYTVAGALSIY